MAALKKRSINDASVELTKFQNQLGQAQLMMNTYPANSQEYIKANKSFIEANDKVKTLKSEIEYFQRLAESKTLDAKISKAKEKLQKAKDLGEDTSKKSTILDTLTQEKVNSDKKINDIKPKTADTGTGTSIGAGISTKLGATGPTGATGPKVGSSGTPSGTQSEKPSGTPSGTPNKKYTIEEIYSMVEKNYGAIDSLFKTNSELKDLVTKSVGPDGIPGTNDDFTVAQFTNLLKDTDWFKSTAGEVQQRGFFKRQYLDVKSRASATELATIEKDNAYARGIANTKLLIKEEARTLGSTLDPTELDSIAIDIYDNANEGNAAVIRSLLRAKIQYSKDKPMGGVAGENLAALKTTAAANGVDLEKQYGNSLQGWLQNISQGESVETYKQIIRGAAKLGMPDKVAGLLDQGVDLATIYSPYKQMMASVLEINPESITLNDPVLRSAIGPDKESSLYDFQRNLRKDNRWQYTDQARGEVSKITKNVLQDFGFQG